MSLKVTCYKMRFVTTLMKLLERYIIVMLILFMAPVILGKTVKGDLLLYSLDGFGVLECSNTKGGSLLYTRVLVAYLLQFNCTSKGVEVTQ